MAWKPFTTHRDEEEPPGKDPLFRRIRQHAEKRLAFKPGANQGIIGINARPVRRSLGQNTGQPPSGVRFPAPMTNANRLIKAFVVMIGRVGLMGMPRARIVHRVSG